MKIMIPTPILFNPWKHHASFIKHQLKQAKRLGLDYFLQAVKAIGNNQMDVYLGELTPAEIGKEIVGILQEKSIETEEDFEVWVTKAHLQYRLLSLKDQSIWTLLWSPNTERYIHIHPARYAPHTMRMRGTSLKTVIMSCAYAAIEEKLPELSLINQVRKEILDLSPVQHLNPKKGLGKTLAYFTQ